MVILSIILLGLSLIYFNKSKTSIKKSIILYFFLVFLYLIFLDIFYIFTYFTWKWLDNSVLYYFRYGWEWTWWLEYKTITFFSIFSLIFIVFIVVFNVKKYLKKHSIIRLNNLYYRKLSFFVLFLALLSNPLTDNILELNWLYDINSFSYSDTLNFDEYYVKPKFNDIDKKKNIVYIYLESYEKMFLDENIFPWLSPNLNKLKENSIYFDNVNQAYWTSWTIAWMVWSQCWIPLEFPWDLDIWETSKSYLSGAFCLWDYLKKAWYDMNYVWWSSMWFAGKWTFYKTHWFSDIRWKDEYITELKDSNYIYSWWMYDDTTFSNAFDRYQELSKNDKPFWLFMINMDTHWDSWVISDSCKNLNYNDDPKSILNSYHCTDFLVSDFINKIKNSPNFKDTIIVIWSDHFAMDNNNVSDTLKENKDDRRLLFMIYDNDDSNDKIISKKWDTLDIWATVLSFMWFKVDKLWLWINLFDEVNIRNPDIILTKWKKEYQNLWR